jgi:hypothetical protein
MKTQILAAIGEAELQPAAELNAALAVNDRLNTSSPCSSWPPTTP